MKMLANPLVSSLVGGLVYLIVTALLLVKGYKPPPPPAPPADSEVQGLGVDIPAGSSTKTDIPSWSYFNPDVEYLVKELKEQRRLLATKEKELRELESRLLAERAELNSVTQHVDRMRVDIDRSIGKINDDEQPNLKRLSKMYSGMEPLSAAKLLVELEPAVATKILHLMKDDQASAILDGMSKTNAEGVKRAVEITKRLRLMQSTPKK
jgi:flagellar motility protein MotE (MotC chaperone)